MRTNFITALIVLIVSGVIGYQTTFTSVNANPTTMVIPKFVEVPRTNSGFNLNIDLNKGIVQTDNSPDRDVSVNIQKKDSIVYKYKYKTLPVEKPVYIKVTPSYARIKSAPSVLAVDMPTIQLEKITLKN